MITEKNVTRDETSKAVVARDVDALIEYKKKKEKLREQEAMKNQLNMLMARVAKLEAMLGVNSGTT